MLWRTRADRTSYDQKLHYDCRNQRLLAPMKDLADVHLATLLIIQNVVVVAVVVVVVVSLGLG